MNEEPIRSAVEQALGNGPLRASELVHMIVEQQESPSAIDEESIRTFVWQLVENNEILWEPDGRLAMPKQAQYA